MTKTLITGNGLVASQLDGIKVSKKDVDLRDYQSTYKKFKELKEQHNLEYIIHTAAKVGGIQANLDSPASFFDDNIAINTNVLKIAHKLGFKKVCSYLSTCVYPDNPDLFPLNENNIHLGEPHSSNFAYAYAKRMVDVQTRAYRKQYGRQDICVIPCNIYGPHDNYHLKDGHVIPSLIHKCYLAKQSNSPFMIWGDGKPLREFIYSKDVAKLSEWALENYNNEKCLILSPGKEYSIGQVVYLIAKYMKFDGEIIFDSTKPSGQYRKPSDNSTLRKLNPDFKFTSIEEGLEESVYWFIQNYDNARK